MDITMTQTFDNPEKQFRNEAREILLQVTEALKVKGYNPVNQIVGYILSGDPAYITSYNGARALLCRLERDELLEEVIGTYLTNCGA